MLDYEERRLWEKTNEILKSFNDNATLAIGVVAAVVGWVHMPSIKRQSAESLLVHAVERALKVK